MLVDGLNTAGEVPRELARKIAAIAPNVAYLSIPTRPPAESWALPPDEATVTSVYQVFSEAGIPVELNVTHEEGAFIAAGEVGESILAITSVHPIREEDLRRTLENRGAPWGIVEELLGTGSLLRQPYRNENYYIARLKPKRPPR
jgi:wyosine [tRNA(Phe)-imidazoG37] synthetase (radical SAM superfamily)